MRKIVKSQKQLSNRSILLLRSWKFSQIAKIIVKSLLLSARGRYFLPNHEKYSGMTTRFSQNAKNFLKCPSIFPNHNAFAGIIK